MKVAVIMGSKSDLPVMQKAVDTLALFDVEVKVQIVSAHRTPNLMYEFATQAKDNKIDVIICGAGGSAHLPGMVAALTPIPVIGVPIKSKALNGIDSLLSIVQMPSGIPVATVAIDGAENAALLAISMLAISNQELYFALDKYRNAKSAGVLNDQI